MKIDSGYEIAVLKGEDKGRAIPLQYREIHFGRRSQTDHEPHWVYFAEPTVSRHHATLVWDETRRHYTLYHKSRTNPTLVNGKPVQHCPLAHGDVVQVGLLVFRLNYVGTRDEPRPARGAAPQPPPNPRRMPELEESEEQGLVTSGLRLVVTTGPDHGSVYELDRPVLFIGRRQGLSDLRGANGILLNDDGLPKEQCLLAWNERERTYGIFQAETSTLPTKILRRVSGEYQTIHLDANMQTLLRVEDIISMGETAMQVTLDVDSAPDVSSGEMAIRDLGRTAIHQTQVAAEEEVAPRGPRMAPAPSLAPPRAAEPPPRARRPEIPVEGVAPSSREASPRPLESEAPTRGPGPEPPVRRREPEPPARRREAPRRDPEPVDADQEPQRPSAAGETVVRNAPTAAPGSGLEEIRFPTLDVNFVRSLPTRPPTETAPRVDRDTLSEGLRPLAQPAAPAPAAAPHPPHEDPFEQQRPLERTATFASSPPTMLPRREMAETTAGGPVGLPVGYRPPELMADDEEEERDFGDTFSWRYRADFIIGFMEGRNKGQKVELLTSQLQDGRAIPVGSKGERTNEIEVDDPGVANRQASVVYQAGRFSVMNEGGPNTLFVNQMALGPNEQMLLKTGDRIQMGETVLIFLERAVVQMLSKFELKVVAAIPEDRGKTFDLLKEVVVIGRLKTCDIALADPEVSRKHLAIALRGGRFYLTHLSSSNPTFINGVSLPRGKDRILNDGDKVQLSDHTVLLFQPRQVPTSTKPRR